MKSIDWELKNSPTFHYVAHEAHRDAAFLSAMKCMEQSVYELSLTYLKRSVQGNTEVGDLLFFIRDLSDRCFDLYQASVHMDIQNQRPPLSKEAGALKSFAFTADEIQHLKTSVPVYLNAANAIDQWVKQHGTTSTTMVDKLIEFMIFNPFDAPSKHGFEDDTWSEPLNIVAQYNQNLDEKSLYLIKKAHIMLGSQIQRLSYAQIYEQLSCLVMSDSDAESQVNECVNSLLLREIDARIIGSSFSDEKSIGFIQDPRVYFNMLIGDVDASLSIETEFRLRMYFIYKTVHFISRIIENNRLMSDINHWLSSQNKPWRIDISFAERLLKSENGGYHAIYGYGAHSRYMSIIRQMSAETEFPSYINSTDALANKSSFLSKLSKVERDELSRRGGRSPFFITGSHLCERRREGATTSYQHTNDPWVMEYAESVKASGMPVCSAGPSGAVFQMARVAGFLGLCRESNENFLLEVQMLKLACLAFMLPGDHTVHEILLQFFNLFGSSYQAGPGFETTIFPADTDYVSATLNQLQAKKGSYVPHLENKSRQALHSLVSSLPLLAPGCQYYTLNQHDLLLEYIDKHRQWLMTDQLSPQKMALGRDKMQLKNQINALSSDAVYQQEGQLVLFHHIHLVVELEKKRILMEKRRDELKAYFTDTAETTITFSADDALEQKYVFFQSMLHAAAETGKLLQSHMCQSKHPFAPITVCLQTRKLEELENPRFLLRARDKVMGYTTNMILNSAYAMANMRDFHANPPYTGATQFSLNLPEFSAMTAYVQDVNARFQLFHFFFKQVFGGQTGMSFSYVGEKLLCDEIEVSRWRLSNRQNSFMSHDIMNFYAKAPRDTHVMIVDALTIDLTQHPERHNLRQLFTDLFKQHEFTNSRGEPKTFYVHEPQYEFMCSLKPEQLCALIPECLSYASLASKAQEMGFTSWASQGFLDKCAVSSPAEMYYQMLLCQLKNFPHVSSAIKARQYFSLPAHATIKTINECYATALDDAFAETYGIGLPCSLEKKVLTDKHIASLLGQQSPQSEVALASNITVYPLSEQGIMALGEILKNSGALEKATPAFRTCHTALLSTINYPYQSLHEVVDGVTQVLITRCQKARQMQQNPYYGESSLKLCLTSWTRFVAYIHYRDELELNDEALDIGLISMCQLFATDDWKNCTNGLAGRLQDILVDLVTASGGGDDFFVQADFDFRKNCATKAFGATVARGAESSMHNKYKADAFNQVRLLNETAIAVMPPRISEQFFNKFNQLYNSATIYRNYYDAMIDTFVKYASTQDDMAMYVFLTSLGLGNTSLHGVITSAKRIKKDDLTADVCMRLDQAFRFFEQDQPGFWDVGRFSTVLPGQLIEAMLLNGVLKLKSEHTLTQSQHAMFSDSSQAGSSSLATSVYQWRS